MRGWVVAWQFMRVARWALWIGTIGFSIYFISNRAPHLTNFGNLKHTTEAIIFGLPGAAVAAGFLELMFRARASGKVEV
jgi:hypothetical protein